MGSLTVTVIRGASKNPREHKGKARKFPDDSVQCNAKQSNAKEKKKAYVI